MSRASRARVQRLRAAADRHLVAARDGIDAEPLLDQREVLVELAEQLRHQPVVVEGDDDMGLVLGERGDGAPRLADGRSSGDLRHVGRISGAWPASVPNRLLAPAAVDA